VLAREPCTECWSPATPASCLFMGQVSGKCRNAALLGSLAAAPELDLPAAMRKACLVLAMRVSSSPRQSPRYGVPLVALTRPPEAEPGTLLLRPEASSAIPRAIGSGSLTGSAPGTRLPQQLTAGVQGSCGLRWRTAPGDLFA
jgi:hypothetical protein